STQHRGVEPDVTLASPINLEDVGESSLDDALPWDRIQGASFSPVDGAGVVLAKLVDEENRRQQRDPDYRWLVNDIAALDAQRERRSVSLNLEARKAERTRLEAERLARENSRRSERAQPPLSSVGDLDASKQPDVVLDQAAEVMTDMVMLSRTPAQAPKKPAAAPTKSVTAQRKTG
ncbi:MAG: hypothetical protein EBZ91_12790, partial [Gammaproteobacteria bacterium]|nr:hypothetical protein [Gammaproteobacteria bacterium]